MADVLVSVRMPEELVNELKKLVKANHFMDLSDEIRSVVRDHWLESKDPYLYEVKKLRAEIKDEVREKSIRRSEQELVKELKRIKERIRNDE